jgi:predicted GNAT family acetyltransferase
MQITRFEAAEDFYQRAESFLLAYEAEHCLILGLCSTLIQQPGYYQNPYLALVEDGQAVLAAALMTPPHNLVLSLTSHPEVFRLIANDLYADFKELPGVSGPTELCQQFAAAWQERSGQAYRLSISERIYRLDKVNPIAGVSGQFRRAAEADRALLLEWIPAFEQDAFGRAVTDEAGLEKIVNAMLTSPIRGAYFWEDGQPVSFAGYGNPTLHGVRIGPVYTPPQFRGRGYASACVAALSQHLLDSGRKFVTLFTDLANPTSNHIYQVIGYNPVMDFDMLEFDPPEES